MHFSPVHSSEIPFSMAISGVVLLLVVIGVIVLVVKGGRGVRIGVGVTFGALALLAAGFLLFARAQFTDRGPVRNVESHTRVLTHDATESGAGPESSTPRVSPAERAWPEGNVNLPLEANIYPSPRSAAVALAAILGSAITDMKKEGDEALPIAVTCVHDPAFVPAFVSALRNAMPSSTVVQYPWKPRDFAEPEINITLILRGKGLTIASEEQSDTGHVGADVEFRRFVNSVPQPVEPAGKLTRVANWVRKPWVEDMAGFLDSDPQRRRSTWFVGYSDATCSSEPEALEQAYHRAADKLLPQTMEAVLRRTGGQITAQARQELLRSLQQSVRSEPLLADVFTQSITRPYGTVYRSAVLVNGSRNDRLVAQFSSQFETRRSSWWRTTMSLAGLGVLLVVVYLFLNAVTKGYYRWTLRLSVLGAIVFVLLLLAICS